MDQLNRDFLEFIGLLDEEAVDYLIVGGYAVGVHGFPRYTGDIDFFVAVSPENADRLIRVFERFGFGDVGLTPFDFLEEDFVVEIGREPRKIQVLTGIDGVRFDECHRNRIEIQHHGRVLKVIGKEDLIRNKAASGRAKDLIDLAELQKI